MMDEKIAGTAERGSDEWGEALETGGCLRETRRVFFKGELDKLKKESFENREVYMIYLRLFSMYSSAETTVVFLDSEYKFLKSEEIEKKTALNIEELSSRLDKAVSETDAACAIIFRNVELTLPEIELKRANSLFCFFDRIRLYDYVVKMGDEFFSLIADFR